MSACCSWHGVGFQARADMHLLMCLGQLPLALAFAGAIFLSVAGDGMTFGTAYPHFKQR